MSSEVMFAVRNITYVVSFFTRLVFLKRMIDMDVRAFLGKVVIPILKVLCLAVLPIKLLMKTVATPSCNFGTFIWQTLLICAYEFPVVYFVGLLPNERLYIKNLVRRKLARNHSN